MANKKRNKQKKTATGQGGADEAKAAGDALDASQDETVLLPPALLLRVLDHVQQPAVLAAAGVCRSWRPIAQSHKDFYGYVSLDADSCRSGKEYYSKVFPFSVSLGDACAVFKRLSVSVLSPLDPVDNGGLRGDGFKAETGALIAIKRDLASICKLELRLAARCCTIFHGFLTDAPAPLLEEFRLQFTEDSGPGPYAPLPGNLFKSSAPLLRRVELEGVGLTEKPIAVFTKAQEVVLDQYSSEQLPFVAPNFPGMTHLTLDFLDLDYDERYPGFPAQGPPLKSLGAKLRRFDLDMHASKLGLATALRQVLEKQALPSVTVALRSRDQLVLDLAPFLSRVGKPFRVSLRQEVSFGSALDTVVEVSSLGSHFRRRFRARAESGLPARLLTGEELRPHVRELELASVLLPEVCACVRSFPRLRSLVIDLDDALDPASWAHLAPMDCPALHSVSLSSTFPRQIAAHEVGAILKLFVLQDSEPPIVLTLVKLQLEPVEGLDALVKEVHSQQELPCVHALAAA